MDARDPSQLRISDADRHRVSEVLREAAGEGRIDLEELEERLEAAYAARTYADLVPITRDLPAGATGRLPERAADAVPVYAAGASHTEERHLAILSGLGRTGVWTVPARLTVHCFMGGAQLDLRRAQFAASEVVITVNALMGGADITVNPSTRVVVEGTGIMGGYTGPSEPEEPDPDAPVVRIRGVAVMGGVSVTRRPAPGRRRRLGRR